MQAGFWQSLYIMSLTTSERCAGCLLGTAVGDALGLPYEGLSARRARRFFTDFSRHHLIMNHGMVSDDTEHAAFVAQALVRSRDDPVVFARCLARSLRWWVLGLPAGVGFATLRATLKLWLGFPPSKSGVYSAGNGPAMRSAIFGVVFAEDHAKLKAFVKASTEITHRDPKAYFASLAVAVAAISGEATNNDWRSAYAQSLAQLIDGTGGDELLALVARARQSAEKGENVADFAASIGSNNGISGYCYHTVPCVLQVWFRFGDDLEHGLAEICGAGGDADTAGAIFGGIVGARAGPEAINREWLDRIWEWPRSIDWLERLGYALGDPANRRPPAYFWPAVVPRNLVFLSIVLAHGLRRLLPPY